MKGTRFLEVDISKMETTTQYKQLAYITQSIVSDFDKAVKKLQGGKNE